MATLPTIEHDAEKNRFAISCPPWLNDLARNIPNRRWNSANKVWFAPAIRANAKYLMRLIDEGKLAAARPVKEALSAALLPPQPIRETFPAWYKFKTTPRPYQRKALDFLWSRPLGGLFMDMGTGKTKVYIDYICAMRMANNLQAATVLCPVSIRDQWVEEIGIHAPIPINSHVFLDGNSYERWIAEDHEFPVLIAGIESMSQGRAHEYVDRFLGSFTKMGINIDEASKIKNHDAIRSKKIVSLGKQAITRHISTGTPISHGPMDLFMEFEFIDPNIIGIGDFYSFRNTYAIMGGFEDKQVVGYKNLDELTEIVSPFVFQVKKSEVMLDLPPKSYQTRTVKMSAEQEDLYKKVKREVEIELDGGTITTDNALTKLLRLSEITSGFYTTDYPDATAKGGIRRVKTPFKTDPKIEELLDIIRETDQSTIIWCAFRLQLERVVVALRKEYGHSSVVEFHGGVAKEDREAAKQLFQTRAARFFCGNAATGGLGLNLQTGTLMCYMSNTFNSIDREQSEDRFYREGQKKPTTVIDILAEKSWDYKCVDNLKMKKDIAQYVAECIRTRRSIL